jgi:Ulp1 family protease
MQLTYKFYKSLSEPYAEQSKLPVTELSGWDIARLAPKQWLNDQIVEFGLRFVILVYLFDQI